MLILLVLIFIHLNGFICRSSNIEYMSKNKIHNLIQSHNKPIFTYIGCYNDRRESRDIADKDFSFITKINKSIPTVELCVQLCAQDSFSIAAVQSFGNKYGKYNATEKTNCFFQCSEKYTCGGYNANSVYFISNVVKKNREKERFLTADISNPCLSSPCLNSGMCIALMDGKGVPRGYICRCTSPQDSGVYCEERNYCFSNPCLNGGSCTNSFNGYACKCTSKWSGTNCNRPLLALIQGNCFENESMCQNGGSCVKHDSSYSCKCLANYSGTMCEVYDLCSSKPCLNDGLCVFKAPSYFECKCTDQFYGSNCEKSNPCFNNLCSNRGVCRINYSDDDYVCACNSRYAGRNCLECKPQFAGQFCEQCKPNYTGANCDQISNQCAPNPCMNNGVCSLSSSDYKCTCFTGWTGKNCTEKNCHLKPCLNQGICTDTFDNFTSTHRFKCACPKGYYGDQCEYQENKRKYNIKSHSKVIGRSQFISIESGSIFSQTNSPSYDINSVCNTIQFSNKCLNGGTCIQLSSFKSSKNNFKCICTNDFSGFYCETNIKSSNINKKEKSVCKENVCQANGNCIEVISDSCFNKGLNTSNDAVRNQTETTLCSNSFCNNNGVCVSIRGVNSKKNMTCTCFTSKTGTNCENDMNPCLSSPCSVGEECIQSIDGSLTYSCNALNFCERMKPCNNNSECIYTKENNTFYCRCLNGASSCDSSSQLNGSNLSTKQPDSSKKQEVQRMAHSDTVEFMQSAKTDSKKQSDIPKLGFNYENLYLILPVALVIAVIICFIGIVIYFAFKARSRTAKFNKKPTPNIRNIQYINDNMVFDENLKPIPNGSNYSVAYSNNVSREKDFVEGFGRV